jgi:CBS domain-containing protein
VLRISAPLEIWSSFYDRPVGLSDMFANAPQRSGEADFAVVDRMSMPDKRLRSGSRRLTLRCSGLDRDSHKKEDRLMKVADAMTSDVRLANPTDSIESVAKIMAADNIGYLPVGEDDRLVGAITDRDIVVRAIARGMGPDAFVRDVMTEDVKYCYDDVDIAEVVQNMGDLQVRRLPVVNRDKRLVGVVSLADAALKHDAESVGIAMSGVVEPGGSHAT